MTKTAFLENELKAAFSAALECKMTKENANEHLAAYNALYEAGLAFLKNVVMLCKSCISKLRSISCDVESAAQECAAHIFWTRLDYILSADESSAIPLIVTMAKRKVSDIFERETAMYRELDETDEYGWSIISSESDIEEECITREGALAAVKALSENKSKLEAIAFLATKLMGMKAGTLSALLMSEKCEKTVRYILSACSDMLALEKNYFDSATFFSGMINADYASEKEFTKEISRASDRAKNKIKKSLSR